MGGRAEESTKGGKKSTCRLFGCNIFYDFSSGTIETFQSSNSSSYGLRRVSNINNGYAIIAVAAEAVRRD